MRAVVVEAPDRLAIHSVPEPSVGPYQVLTRTLSCGLCGTDKRIVSGHFYRRSFPGILGHEAVGRVVERGGRVRNLAVGDLVLRTTAVYPNDQLGGFSSLLGGLAEYGIATDWEALRQDQPGCALSPWWLSQQKLPTDFDAMNGGMFITLKEILSWVAQLRIQAGKSVAVVGLGPVGLTLIRVCKLLGASPVVAIGRKQQRLAMAEELGADVVVDNSEFAREGLEDQLATRFDFILDSAGDLALLERLPGLLNDRGQLAIYSVPEEQRMVLDWSWGGNVPRNWSLVFRVPQEHDHHQQALDYWRLGLFDPGRFMSHAYQLEDMQEAWNVLTSGEAVKIVIRVNS